MANRNSLSVNLSMPVGLKAIDKNISFIAGSMDKVNKLIHATAMGILAHAQEHGDCTRALTLMQAMPASMRRTMLKQWFETFTPIRFQMQDGKAVKVGLLKPEAKKFTPFDFNGGNAKPFYELAEENPEQQPLTFDKLVKLVQALTKKAEKQIEEGKVANDDIEKVQEMARKLKAVA